MSKPPFGSGDLETMNKLFLELSLVCDGAETWRDLQNKAALTQQPLDIADWLLTQTFPDDDGTDTYKRAYNNALHDAAKRLREGRWRKP